MSEPTSPPEQAIAHEDPIELARSASLDELQRIKAAEELLQLRFERKKRGSRW
jgi:hypothetical protein